MPTNKILGIDCSRWQSRPNWQKAKDSGVQFAIVKAGEVWIKQLLKPTVKDIQHDRNILELKRIGIICGDYYYFHPSIGASRQARHYAEIRAKNIPDLPPVIDIEDSDKMKPTDVGKQLLVFIAELKVRTGEQPIIYSRNGFLVNQAGNIDYPAGTLFWIARYGKTIGDLSPKIKPNVVMWQYTDRLKLPGLPQMDGNYWLLSLEELQDLANWAEGEPPIQTQPIPEPELPIVVGKTGIVSASILNVRLGAGIEYRVLGQLYRGNEIKILNIVNNRWAEFKYKNYTTAFCAISGESGIYVEVK